MNCGRTLHSFPRQIWHLRVLFGHLINIWNFIDQSILKYIDMCYWYRGFAYILLRHRYTLIRHQTLLHELHMIMNSSNYPSRLGWKNWLCVSLYISKMRKYVFYFLFLGRKKGTCFFISIMFISILRLRFSKN